MSRVSNREKILTEGLRVIHERGFGGASVRGIAQAANVPLGSFTSNFPSKEAFGLELLDRYHQQSQLLAAKTLGDKSLTVRERLNVYFDNLIGDLSGQDIRWGSLLGIFYAGMANQSEILRRRLAEISLEIRASMRVFLEEGVASGELRADLDCDEAAEFIYSSLQGALLFAKALRAPSPVENCRKQIMRHVLN